MDPYFKDYESAIERISRERGLYCLADYGEVTFDNQSALELAEVISSTRMEINTLGCLDEKISDLIESISPDIKFAVANTYLYLSGSNNFLKERVRVASTGQEYSTYNQTLADKRYFFFVNVAFEKLYNYWDRIGDVLNESFSLNIRPDQVYFDAVIRELARHEDVFNNPNFALLERFRTSSYQTYINRIRRMVVHVRHKDTYFRFKWVESFGDGNNIETMRPLQTEKEGFPTLLHEQLRLANDGYGWMMRLISECGPIEKAAEQRIVTRASDTNTP